MKDVFPRGAFDRIVDLEDNDLPLPELLDSRFHSLLASEFEVIMTQRPYLGLRPFDYPDQRFFFGRQEQIYALYRLIDRSRFVSVVGSSGSGKSSLVRAGLLPLLDEESREAGCRVWKRKVMRPGTAPIATLAKELAALTTDDEPALSNVRRERLAFDLRRSSFGLAEALSKIPELEDAAFLLVVDQFEELFRYAAQETSTADGAECALSRDEAAHFVQLLIEGARAATCEVHVVITMRSDFIGDCARFHGLSESVSGAQFLVPGLTRPAGGGDHQTARRRRRHDRAGACPAASERLQRRSRSASRAPALHVASLGSVGAQNHRTGRGGERRRRVGSAQTLDAPLH